MKSVSSSGLVRPLTIPSRRYIRGKRAICLSPTFAERKKNFVGQHFWARGFHVSTAGRDETVIREDTKTQEREDTRQNQLGLWK